MRRSTARGAAVAALLLTAFPLVGCGGSAGGRPVAARSDGTATATASGTPAGPASAGPHRSHRSHRRHRPSASPAAQPRVPPFRAKVGRVTAAGLGASWHPGCPVGPAGLRLLRLSYWGFDGRPHLGRLVGAASAVGAYVAAFRALYAARFPLRRLRPVSAYGGSDDRSMRHDNTSAFNCRYAVSDGPRSWSMHAYGTAVDIDPLENPYLLDGKVLPRRGAPYLDRSRVRPGMVVAGSVPVRAFAAVGWGWGGSWPSSPDYQHFSVNGR